HGAPVSLPKLKKAYEKVAVFRCKIKCALCCKEIWHVPPHIGMSPHMLRGRGGLTTHGAPGQ
ncbi:unnamed protein product, partial [Staurois parvus]